VARQGLDRDRVVDAATAIADAEGVGAVTLARVAADLGVRSPSLYNHVDGLDGLRRAIALRALRELHDTLRDAATGRAGAEALVALAEAYRDYARAHPGRYALTQTDAIHATRAFRATVHGFVDLETSGGFALGVDVDESFRRLIAALAAGLADQAS
jgi:AcrR family transcriptional regulator